MADVPDEIAGQLRRQRRFMVLMSLAVIAYFVFGLDLESELDYAGMSLRARDPRYVLWALWVVWGWSVLRFLQCGYKALTLVTADIRAEVNQVDERIVARIAGRAAKRQVRNGEREEEDNIPRNSAFLSPVEFRIHDTETIRTAKVLSHDIERYYVPAVDGGRSYPNIYARFKTTAGGYRATVEMGMNLTLNKWEVRWVRARAWLYACLGMPGISEHVMPVVLALAAVVAAATLDPNACHAQWCLPGVKPVP